jgi:hypothetical protein
MCLNPLLFIVKYILFLGAVGLFFFLTSDKPDWKGPNELSEAVLGMGIFGLTFVIIAAFTC